MNNKNLKIGLFGFGVVGEGIYKVLQQTPGLLAEIVKICIKNPDKKRDAPRFLFTTNAKELLLDKNINVIVELIDDAVAAFEIVKTAIQQGKHVVSANKKMIAENLDELLELTAKYNVSLLYEAAVCGSIPVIRNLEEYYDNDLLNSFSGIVNGSTNYILTKIKEEGLNYESALLQAQSLGFAESNPALDVEGVDAANKLTIILKHAYGISCKPDEIIQKGITCLHPADAIYANEKGFNIKLIAFAKQIDKRQIVAYVLPTFVDGTSQLYHIRNEFNGVLIGSTLADEQFLYGKGAGRYPTSSAVLSDIAALRYNYRYEYKKSQTGNYLQLTGDFALRVFVSFADENLIAENDFIEIEESYSSPNRKFIVGTILIENLAATKWFNHPEVSVIAVGEADCKDEKSEYENKKSVLELV